MFGGGNVLRVGNVAASGEGAGLLFRRGGRFRPLCGTGDASWICLSSHCQVGESVASAGRESWDTARDGGVIGAPEVLAEVLADGLVGCGAGESGRPRTGEGGRGIFSARIE